MLAQQPASSIIRDLGPGSARPGSFWLAAGCIALCMHIIVNGCMRHDPAHSMAGVCRTWQRRADACFSGPKGKDELA